MYIPDAMSRRKNPFIVDDDGSTSVPRTSLEAQLIRMLLYVSYRTSCDSRVKRNSRSHQEGCCNIKSDGRICLGSHLSKKVGPTMR